MPDSLNAASGNGQVVLSWLDPGNGTITGYQVRYEESGTVLPEWSDNHDIVSSAATTMHTVPNLTNGTEYTFEVRAKNKAGPGSAASVTAEAGSRAPTNLAWALDDAGNVVLTWDPPSIDAASVTRYEIHNTDALGSGTIHPDGTTTRYVDESVPLEEYTHYTYRVRALRGAQPSAWSNTISVEVPRLGPKAPDSLKAVAGVGQVLLTWQASPDAAVTGYQARHGSDPASLPHWVELAGSGRTTTMHTVQNLTNGTEYTFEVRAKAGTVHGDSATATATPAPQTVTPPPPPPPMQTPLTVACPGDQAGQRCTFKNFGSATAEGGAPSYTYSIGGAPQGIGINSSTGAITGAPSETGPFAVTVTANDSKSATATCSFGVNVGAPPPLTISCPANQTVSGGGGISVTASASVGCFPYTYGNPTVVKSDANGPDLTLSIAQTGVISGTAPSPNVKMVYTVTVPVDDDGGQSASCAFTITVPPCNVDVGGLPSGTVTATVCVPIDAITATGSGGQAPYSFSLSTQPPSGSGLSIDGTSGRITGIPAATGPFTVMVGARDSGVSSGSGSFGLNVECRTITVGGLSDVKVTKGTAIPSQTATATGGCGTVVFAIEDGPPGIGINPSTGEITGTPTAAGEFTPKVTATDGAKCTGNGSFTITVCEPVVLGGIEKHTVEAGSSVSIAASARGGCGSIRYSISGQPGDVEIDDTTGDIFGSVGPNPDTYTVTVKATDTELSTNSTTTEFEIEVKPRSCRVTVGGLPSETVGETVCKAISNIRATAIG